MSVTPLTSEEVLLNYTSIREFMPSVSKCVSKTDLLLVTAKSE